ncbi:hypothetical protein VCRA2114E365_40218 [Vibrio crassostreae]|nr:hypothetical protein VCRA2113O351_30083 [Vibrio crassostreae]CAK2106047.1 hypothetical protein VCRA2113O358_40082 [Vibrio crassostreae]CAK2114158.1 hypothetical protein VCRA2113O359_40082 [Vibrio crassostreae]CAK2114717.1 hypothetical protein VCRA2113O354_40082 [Vibrio crassostreae]CAK2122027.1 hypothetical protein VCRA2113O357_40218 [Vibrio crassostreae]
MFKKQRFLLNKREPMIIWEGAKVVFALDYKVEMLFSQG